MYCSSCGNANTEGTRFCVACGQRLIAAPTPATPVTAQQPIPAYAAVSVPTVPVSAVVSTAVPQVVNNISLEAPAPTVVVVNNQQGPGLIVRGLYFYFFGAWAGLVCSVLAWTLNATIIGLPLGLMIINRLPQIMTLKPSGNGMQVSAVGGVVVVRNGSVPQNSMILRAIYFLLIGSWFSGIWMAFAWAAIVATFGLALPISFWMFNRVPAITTLRRG